MKAALEGRRGNVKALFFVFLLMELLVLAPTIGSAATDPDTLVIADDTAPNNLHPGANAAYPNIRQNFLIYDSLIIQDYAGKIYPLLAKSWEASKDGKVWTFHLRNDVKFHSGRRFTAKDVKAHFDLWKTFPTASKIESLEETNVVDDYTVQFKLKYPNLVFLYMISQTEFSYSGIPDSEAVNKYGADYGILPESVSGTGPFILKKWIRGDRTEFERNPEYKWGPTFYKNTGPAHIKKLVIRTMGEEASRSAALERKEIDINLYLSTKDAPRFQKMKGIQVLIETKPTADNVAFNHSKPLSKDLNLRKALMHAIDREIIIAVVYNGFADPKLGLWSEYHKGHTPKEEIVKIAPEYNPELAKKLLDEAGWKPGTGGIRYKDGKPLQFTVYVYTETQTQIMTLIQEMWRKIGVDASIRQLEKAAWDKAARAGEPDMRYIRGGTTTEDFAYYFICKSIPYPNHMFWCDPQTDKFFEITQTTLSDDERIKAFQDMEKDLLRRAVLIPMPDAKWVVGTSEEVKDLKLHPSHGIYKLLDIRKIAVR